jgi:hypothetical protein
MIRRWSVEQLQVMRVEEVAQHRALEAPSRVRCISLFNNVLKNIEAFGNQRLRDFLVLIDRAVELAADEQSSMV